jgi:hypothetical protein
LIYFSYDARLGGPENGKRWSDEERGFGKRAYLEVQKDTINQILQDRPKAILSYLHIQDIHANEAGLYKCRVDFKTAPTKNYYMNLSVIGKLLIYFKNYLAFVLEIHRLHYCSKFCQILLM